MPTTPEQEKSRSVYSGLVEIDQAAYEAAPPEVREAIDRDLAELERSLEANPLQGYFPHEKQKRYHEAKETIRAYMAASRAGKSTAGTADDLIQALPPEFVPEHLVPYKRYGFDVPFKGRIITPDLGHTMQVAVDKLNAMVPQAALRGGKWEKAFDKVHKILHFARGDRIDFMSTLQAPNQFGGIDLNRVRFDEEPAGPNSWPIFRDSYTRLWDRGGNLDFTMTPLMNTDWVHDKIWEERDQDHIFAIRASVWDNPHMPHDEIRKRLMILSAEERRAVEYGEFVHFEGTFYDEFDEDIHVRPSIDAGYLDGMDVVVGIDPGSRTGVVWVAFDPDNVALVFDEFYPEGMVVPDIAEEIHKRNEMWGIEPAYVIDPAARIRTGPSQEQFTTEFARHKIYCGSGQNARGPGIMEVKRRLQKQGIYFSSHCPELIRQMPRYRKEPDAADEWAAVKQTATVRFDLLDAMRYAVMERTWHIPKTFKPKRSNYNSDPTFEPPWKPPLPEAPPLGAYS